MEDGVEGPVARFGAMWMDCEGRLWIPPGQPRPEARARR